MQSLRNVVYGRSWRIYVSSCGTSGYRGGARSIERDWSWNEMSRLFILGTGFSAAVLEAMGHKNKLTMGDLGRYVKKYVHKLPGDPKEYERIMSESNDVEMLLTYLYQNMPWKLSEEIHMDKSAFLFLSRLIADYISECEEKAFPKDTTLHEPPEWCREFAQYLHDRRAVVATFNYDTVLERLSYYIEIEQEEPKEETIEERVQRALRERG